MIADVDLESEVLRCMGSARTTIYALICIARLRGYRGRLSYLPVSRPHRICTTPTLPFQSEIGS